MAICVISTGDFWHRDECTLIVQKQGDGPGGLIVPEIIHSKRVMEINNKESDDKGR